MFDLLVFVMINALWVALILLVILLGFRTFYAIKNQLPKRKLLLMIFLPFSIGFYQHVTHKKLLKVYETIVIIQFILMFLASIFILYLRLELNII